MIYHHPVNIRMIWSVNIFPCQIKYSARSSLICITKYRYKNTKCLDITQNNIWRTLRANLLASYLSTVHAFSESLLFQFFQLCELSIKITFMTYIFSIIYSFFCCIKINYCPLCLQNHISQCTRLHIFNGILMKMISYRKAALYKILPSSCTIWIYYSNMFYGDQIFIIIIYSHMWSYWGLHGMSHVL